jgi:putative N6-adenine-specific DNA methylase
MIKEERFDIVVTTFQGMEDLVIDEINALGIEEVEKLRRAVKCKGTKKDLYRLNLHLRTALRVLVPIAEFTVRTEEQLYNSILSINWLDYFTTRKTFAIDSVVNSEFFRHSQYAGLKSKDAIADRFRKELGARPDVDPLNPDLRINIHITNDRCTVSLDSSGDPLFKRGYRAGQHPAQLNECLAAGLILRSDWNQTDTFIDPMCGSGTLPIEAALIAYNIPPGIFRTKFGFEGWSDFDKTIYRDIFEDIEEDVEKDLLIFGTDVNKTFTKLAIDNARNASLFRKIKILTKAFEDFEAPQDKGVIIINPPYGERLKKWGIEGFYKLIGDQLKKHYSGYSAWIFSSNYEAMKNVGLKASKKYTMYNGPLECKFVNYSLYQGSKKENA